MVYIKDGKVMKDGPA